MAAISSAFANYRNQFSTREPDLAGKKHDDELQLLTPEQGRRELPPAPIADAVFGVPPSLEAAQGTGKYLWVVMATAIPIATEILHYSVHFSRGHLSHTNLTGGEPAHCGGEIWFIDDSSVVFNGASGRYPARNAAELEKIAASLREAGFRVASMGWNAETGRSHRSLRGGPQWT